MTVFSDTQWFVAGATVYRGSNKVVCFADLVFRILPQLFCCQWRSGAQRRIRVASCADFVFMKTEIFLVPRHDLALPFKSLQQTAILHYPSPEKEKMRKSSISFNKISKKRTNKLKNAPSWAMQDATLRSSSDHVTFSTIPSQICFTYIYAATENHVALVRL